MASDNPNEYKFPFRTNYEIYIVVVWVISALLSFVCPFLFDVPKEPYWLFSAIAVLIGLVTGRYGIEIFVRKSRLKGYPLEFMDSTSNEAMKLFGIKDKEVLKNVKSNRK